MGDSNLRELVRAREDVITAALAWDDEPGDPDLCLALSDACHRLRIVTRAS